LNLSRSSRKQRVTRYGREQQHGIPARRLSSCRRRRRRRRHPPTRARYCLRATTTTTGTATDVTGRGARFALQCAVAVRVTRQSPVVVRRTLFVLRSPSRVHGVLSSIPSADSPPVARCARRTPAPSGKIFFSPQSPTCPHHHQQTARQCWIFNIVKLKNDDGW